MEKEYPDSHTSPIQAFHVAQIVSFSVGEQSVIVIAESQFMREYSHHHNSPYVTVNGQ